MARPCSVCVHPKRVEIDAWMVKGASNRRVAKQYDVSDDAVQRHRKHIGSALAEVTLTREERAGNATRTELDALWSEAKRLGEAAEEKGDLRAALTAVREMTRLYELQARLVLQARSDARDVARHPVYLELQADLLAVTRGCVACSEGIARKMRQRLGITTPELG